MGVIAATICIGLACVPSQVYVYDGDTFRVGRDWYRIANIDAPEIVGSCHREKVLAHSARDRLEELLELRTVRVTPVGLDRWQRQIAHVTILDQDVGEVLLKDGLARKWTKKWNHQPEPWCL